MSAATWQAARRVLLVRLDNLGDVLMTTPAMAALRESTGGEHRHLSLLTSPSGAALMPHLPWIDEGIAYDAPWAKGGGAPRDPAADAALLAKLAQGRFDAAIVFTVCTQSALPAALLCRLAGIPLRLAHCRENPYELLSDWQPDRETVTDGMRHEVDRQLDLVRAVGFQPGSTRLRFDLRDGDRASWKLRLAALGIDGARPFVLMHPGATAASRRWPVQRFGEVAARLARDGTQVLVAGGAADRDAVMQIVGASRAAGGPPVIALSSDLAPDLSLGELAAAIEAAELLVCNNSGPAHLAAALQTPVVALYAMTNPQHTPWQVPRRVLQRPDVACRHCLKSVCPQAGHPCLSEITATQVIDAIRSLRAELRAELRAQADGPPVFPVAA